MTCARRPKPQEGFDVIEGSLVLTNVEVNVFRINPRGRGKRA